MSRELSAGCCPKCGSIDVESNGVGEFYLDTFLQECSCSECGCSYVETYRFESTEVIDD